MALFTADRLLKEIHPKDHDSELRYRVMEANVLMASSQARTAIDKAITIFTDIATTEVSERTCCPSFPRMHPCEESELVNTTSCTSVLPVTCAPVLKISVWLALKLRTSLAKKLGTDVNCRRIPRRFGRMNQ